MQNPMDFEWVSDQELRDAKGKGRASNSASSGSSHFGSASSVRGPGSSGTNQDFREELTVGEDMRKRSSSRFSNSSGKSLKSSRPSTSGSSFGGHARGQQPYPSAADKHRMSTLGLLPGDRPEDHLEDLWSMHGVHGSAHLGVDLTRYPVYPNLPSHFGNLSQVYEDLISEAPDYEPYFGAPERQSRPYEIYNSFTSVDKSTSKSPSYVHDLTLHKDTDRHGDGKSQNPTTNNFVRKLYQMVGDPKAAHFVCWTELGTSFVVSIEGERSRSILEYYFKHSNFSSLVRQLNMYGFHRINRTRRNQRALPNMLQWEFSHEKFLRGREDLLDEIKRKPSQPDPSSARQKVDVPSLVAAKMFQFSMDYAEVDSALQSERQKVAQLAEIVKVLYDRVALMSETGKPPTEIQSGGRIVRLVIYGRFPGSPSSDVHRVWINRRATSSNVIEALNASYQTDAPGSFVVLEGDWGPNPRWNEAEPSSSIGETCQVLYVVFKRIFMRYILGVVRDSLTDFPICISYFETAMDPPQTILQLITAAYPELHGRIESITSYSSPEDVGSNKFDQGIGSPSSSRLHTALIIGLIKPRDKFLSELSYQPIPALLQIPFLHCENLVQKAYSLETFALQMIHLSTSIRHLIISLANEMQNAFVDESPGVEAILRAKGEMSDLFQVAPLLAYELKNILEQINDLIDTIGRRNFNEETFQTEIMAVFNSLCGEFPGAVTVRRSFNLFKRLGSIDHQERTPVQD